jgi:hypothetical protein
MSGGVSLPVAYCSRRWPTTQPSPSIIEWHLSNVFRKLGISNRRELGVALHSGAVSARAIHG